MEVKRSTDQRNTAREKLRRAGILATDLYISDDAITATDDELERLGVMRSGARPSEELIASYRGR